MRSLLLCTAQLCSVHCLHVQVESFEEDDKISEMRRSAVKLPASAILFHFLFLRSF